MILTLLLVIATTTQTVAQEQKYMQPPTDTPFQVYKEPHMEIQDNARIHYDTYGRAIYIEEKFPLGYSATTEYTWWPNTYLREDGAYEPRMQKETGKLFNKQNEQTASYSIIYDEEGNEAEKTTEGNQLVKRLLSLFAKILGIEVDEQTAFP